MRTNEARFRNALLCLPALRGGCLARYAILVVCIIALGCGSNRVPKTSMDSSGSTNKDKGEPTPSVTLESSEFPDPKQDNIIVPGTNMQLSGSLAVSNAKKKQYIAVAFVYRKNPDGTRTVVENVSGEAMQNERGTFDYRITVKAPDKEREYEVGLILNIGENGVPLNLGKIVVKN